MHNRSDFYAIQKSDMSNFMYENIKKIFKQLLGDANGYETRGIIDYLVNQ